VTRLVYLPTSVNWPEGVPPPLRWKVGTSPLSTVKSRRTESGRTEVRRFGSGEPDKLEAVWLLTASEYQIFRRFYEGPPWYAKDGTRLDCQLGAVWITADWLWELGYYHHEIRFWSSPRARRFGTAVEVTATMLIQHEDRIVREWPLWEWTCFITAARVTHFYSELLVPSLPELRVTQFYSEQFIHGLATARVTDLYSEQLIHGLATARVTDLYSEVLYLPRAKSRVTRFYAELLVKINYGGGPGSEGGMFDGTCKIIFQKSSLFDGRAVVVFSLYAYVTQQRAEVGYVGANPTTYITQQRAEVGYVGANPTTYITQQRAEVGYIIRRNKTNTFDGKVTIAS